MWSLCPALLSSLSRQSLCLPQEMLFPAHLLQVMIQNSLSRWKLWICLPVMPSRGHTAPRGDPATDTKGAGAFQSLHWDLRGSFSPASLFTFHRFYGTGCALQQPFYFFFFPQEFTAGAGLWRVLAGKSQAPGKKNLQPCLSCSLQLRSRQSC